jgi:acetyltransferase
VLLFGMGGTLVELFRDRQLALPPLTTTLARRMIERTTIAGAFRGIRGRRPIDTAALEQLLVRFSLLVVEQRRIAEIDINPLLASPERLLALDARVVLHDPDVARGGPAATGHPALPAQYVDRWAARDGSEFTIRPIRPEDEPLLVQFHKAPDRGDGLLALLPGARPVGAHGPRAADARLLQRLRPRDRARRRGGRRRWRRPTILAAIARLSKDHWRPSAEFAILVADRWQKRGLGAELLRRLVQIGRDEGLELIWAEMLAGNAGMRRTAQTVGFTLIDEPGEPTRAELVLDGP